MNKNILVVDDEKEIADLLDIYLTNENYNVFKYYLAQEGLKCIEENKIDLAILDIMLPDGDGLSMCQEIRKRHVFPIIMLTAKNKKMDKINGLTFGADDYITKPFELLEVVARVKAQLRRHTEYNTGENSKDILIHRGLEINLKTYEVTLNDRPIALTPTQFSILKIIMAEDGKVISYEDLFHRVSGDDFYDKETNSMAVHIRHLRKKLGDPAEEPKYIRTVWGVGYKLEK